jgi:MoxR-like ATPase
LADEINRAPAKTQSALLEAMQEKTDHHRGRGPLRSLGADFIVSSPPRTRSSKRGPIPLPEAQIDRFLVRILMGYPRPEDERRVLRRFMEGAPTARTLLEPGQILTMQSLVDDVHVEDDVVDYVVRLAGYTRQQARIFLGASPRAALALITAARARALIAGRAYVLPDDVKVLAVPVLAHRLVLTPEAEMDGTSREALIQKALGEVPHRKE